MGSTRGSVHLCCGYRSISASLFHLLLNWVISVDVVLGQALNVNTKGFVLSDFVSLLGPFSDRNQQILDLLVINLKHRNIDLILFIGVIIFLYSIEDLFARNWDYSLQIRYFVPCWFRIRPSNRTFQLQFGHKQIDSNGILPMRCLKFINRLFRRLAVDLHTCRLWVYLIWIFYTK